MKWLLTLLAVGMVFSFAPGCFADNFLDDTADVFKGRNEDIPLDLYLAKTIDLEKVPYIKMLNADLRIKASSPVGDNFCKEGRLEAGLEF